MAEGPVISGLVPREILGPAGITALHRDLRREVYWLRDALETTVAQSPSADPTVGTPEDPDLPQAVNAQQRVQFYSRAVQVFALLTVEAALNTYGLLRFDEEAFERKAEKTGPATKVKILLEAATGAPLDADDEIVQIVDRLARRRNALVHPRAELYLLDGSGTYQAVSSPRPAPVDREAALAAIADMDRFLELLPQRDPEVANLVDSF